MVPKNVAQDHHVHWPAFLRLLTCSFLAIIISMKRARFPRSSWSQFVFPSQQKSFGCVTMPSQASAFAQDTSCARRTLVPRFNANDSLLLYEVKRSNCRVNLRILKCILVTFSSALWQTLAWCPSHSCTLWSFPRDWKEPCLSRWCCSWASALLQCHPFALHPLACCRPCAPQNVLDALCDTLAPWQVMEWLILKVPTHPKIKSCNQPKMQCA